MEWRISAGKKVWALLLMLCAAGAAGAERAMFLPLISYDHLALDSRTIHSPGAGLIVIGEQTMALGFYTLHTVDGAAEDTYPSLYHSIEGVIDGGKGRHTWLAVFKSASDKPVYGGLGTFQSAAAYGYTVADGARFTLILGGGVAVSDFGMETSGGDPWPLLPVPFIRMNYASPRLEASFEFITGLGLGFTIAPESRVRVTGDFRMDKFRGIEDLILESALHYRLGPADLAAGVRNDVQEFAVAGEEEPQEIQYYSAFGTVDLALAKVTGGYVFDGPEGETGMYLCLQGMYRF